MFAKPERNGIVAAEKDIGKTQPLEATLAHAALPIVPAYLIVQALLDVFVGRNHFRMA